MNVQTDIRDVLTELQDAREIGMGHVDKLTFCLRHWAANGVPLSTCADSRHLNRSISTLRRYASNLGLRFPDWVPMALRTKEERKRKRKPDSTDHE